MADSRHVGSRWQRIVGTLFDASLAAATLGIARMVFGVAIDLGPGPALSLGSGGPWPPFVLATVLFVAAASLRPARRPRRPPDDQALTSAHPTLIGIATRRLTPLELTERPATGRAPGECQTGVRYCDAATADFAARLSALDATTQEERP